MMVLGVSLNLVNSSMKVRLTAALRNVKWLLKIFLCTNFFPIPIAKDWVK